MIARSSPSSEAQALQKMDHLPLPSDPSIARAKVPYILAADHDLTQPSDEEAFLDYPSRVGWPQVIPSAQLPEFKKYDLAHPSDDRALERFFQAYLFFGLLHVVLQDLYDPEDYITREPEHGLAFVHTSKLLDRLEAWRKRQQQLTSEEKHAVYDKLLPCLYRAEDALSVLGPERPHQGFNPALKYALVATGEVLTCAIDSTLFEPGETRSPNAWSRTYWDAAVEDDMKSHGWCPRDVASVRTSFNTLSAVEFTRRLRKPELGINHAQCIDEVCVAMQLNPDHSAFELTHTAGDCHCQALGPKLIDIVQSLESGKTPLLRIEGESADDMIVHVVPRTANVAYVALSHVWADGLGNPNANELSRCQLLRLKSLIESLRGMQRWNSQRPEQRELLLWCDSLCVPVAPGPTPTLEQERQQALGMKGMRAVYADAAYVLVLDREVSHHHLGDIGMLEGAMRCMTSRWMGRLWTLQEAVLAKSLLIQFADRVVDLRELWQFAKTLHNSEIGPYAICVDIVLWCHNIRTFFNAAEGTAGSDLATTARSIHQRRVSKPHDEPLCIATVLDLDPQGNVARAAGPDRMPKVWQLMPRCRRGIPKTIIFAQLPRISKPGFRWAPATLQQSIASTSEIPVTHNDDPNMQGVPCPQGLQVKFPGWRIRVEQPPHGLPEDLWTGNSLANNFVHLRGPDGTWYWIQRLGHGRGNGTIWDMISDPSKDVALILGEQHNVTGGRWQGLQKGVIGTVIENKDDARVVQSMAVVGVPVATPNDAALWQAALDFAEDLKREPSVSRISELARQPEHRVTELQEEYKALVQQLEPRVMEVANEALQDPAFAARVNRSVQQGGQVNTFVGALIALKLMGRYAVAEEEFPPDTQWIVD